ncbi:MAG: hypothetical protein WCJ30_04145, partial [Deltaproteobacteria bacterium]
MNCKTPLFALTLAACAPPTPAGIDAARDAGPDHLTIGSESVSVAVGLRPFSLRVTNAAGRTVLDTVPAGATIAHDPDQAYTAFGATHRQQSLRSPIIEGWDHVAASDDPWHRTSEVVSASATDTTASLDLVDPTDRESVVHVEIAVRGAEMRVDATLRGVGDAGTNTGMDAGAARGLNELGQAFVLAD